MRTARGRLRFVALPPAPSTTRGRPWEALPHRTRRGWHVPTRRGATANEPSPSLVLSVPMYYPSRLADKLRGTVANDVASFGKSHRVSTLQYGMYVCRMSRRRVSPAAGRSCDSNRLSTASRFSRNENWAKQNKHRTKKFKFLKFWELQSHFANSGCEPKWAVWHKAALLGALHWEPSN